MKLSVLLSLVIFTINISLNGQEVQFGAKGGVNVSTVSGENSAKH